MEPNNTSGQGTKSLKEYFKSWSFWRPFSGTVIGVAGGFLYYYFIGCNTGTCPITSSPYGSMLMGGLLGFLLFSSFGESVKKA